MTQSTKDAIYQIFIIAGLILLSILVMYFSYKQSRSYYYDADGYPKKEVQEMFRREDASRVFRKQN